MKARWLHLIQSQKWSKLEMECSFLLFPNSKIMKIRRTPCGPRVDPVLVVPREVTIGDDSVGRCQGLKFKYIQYFPENDQAFFSLPRTRHQWDGIIQAKKSRKSFFGLLQWLGSKSNKNLAEVTQLPLENPQGEITNIFMNVFKSKQNCHGLDKRPYPLTPS